MPYHAPALAVRNERREGGAEAYRGKKEDVHDTNKRDTLFLSLVAIACNNNNINNNNICITENHIRTGC